MKGMEMSISFQYKTKTKHLWGLLDLGQNVNLDRPKIKKTRNERQEKVFV